MATAGTMRLSRFPTLRATSFDELEGLLASKGLRAERTGPGSTACMNTAYRDGWYLAHMDYEMPLRIAAEAHRDDFTLYLPLAGAVRASDGRDSVDCDGSRTVMASPGRPLLTLSAPRASRVNLTIKRDVLMRHLTALLGEAPARLPSFVFVLDRTRPAVRSYLRYLWGVIDALDQDAGFLDQPMMGGAVEQALVSGLLLAQPNDFSERLAARSGAPAPADVKRAVDYIHAHLEEDMTLADLASVAGVPARTLQTHFRDRFGCGPMRYLRDRRLCQARRELQQGDPATSVTDVALRWGFGSLGRFAVSYRERFGESPSHTLRSSRNRALSAASPLSRR